jgi:hypothetical protein
MRIDSISKIELIAYPPSKAEYPDVEAVQLVAYHRIVFYRELLDEVLGDKNRFWNVHRKPSWCRDVLNFQLVKPRTLEI